MQDKFLFVHVVALKTKLFLVIFPEIIQFCLKIFHGWWQNNFRQRIPWLHYCWLQNYNGVILALKILYWVFTNVLKLYY